MAMTSRERVQAVLEHETPDRVPIILGVSNATGIKMAPYQGIKKMLGIKAPDDYLYNWPELGTAKIDEETMKRLHSDVRGVLDRFPKQVYDSNSKREPHSPCIDDWGGGQVEIEPGIWFPGYYPLADATTVQELEDYQGWPDMDDPTRIAHVTGEAQKLAEENEYAIMATPWLMFPFERAFSMQGMDKFLLNLAMYPDFAEALLKKNAVVAFLADQYAGSSATRLKFLGQECPSFVGPVQAARRFDSPVVVTVCVYEEGKPVIYVDGPVPIHEEADEQTTIVKNTERINDVFAKYIHRYPDQYAWGHRRFDRHHYAKN